MMAILSDEDQKNRMLDRFMAIGESLDHDWFTEYEISCVESCRKERGKDNLSLRKNNEEGGRRESAQCFVKYGKDKFHFHPLAVVSKEWEQWLIDKYHIRLCDIYYPPYNFTRTGCKGCPFNPTLQKDLDTLERYFPNERKQCEVIWEPVYEEYRKIGYRLKKQRQTTIFDFIGDEND